MENHLILIERIYIAPDILEVGFAIGDIENAYANLYFGGFGNNVVCLTFVRED